jgi:diaminopimelate decarboxylase
MHSGPNPSPGLGIARSLRGALPGVRLIGVDYSPASSGLHSNLLDDTVLLPGWGEVHPATWVSQIRELLSSPDAVFIPSLDLEIRLLAEQFGEHDRLLAPGRRALATVDKPPTAVADAFGLPVPAHTLATDPLEVRRFLRHCANGGWVKGRAYEAFRVYDAAGALDAGRTVTQRWGEECHIEEHVHGQECAIAFCARGGTLLDAVFMAKSQLTPEGKTWSGLVEELDPALWERLVAYVADSRWSGGGEIELIRSWSGSFTVMEVNPRFPAWINGASVCGACLPAALLTGTRRPADRALRGGFTRVVEEIAVAAELGAISYGWGVGGAPSPAKHPSGMSTLALRRLIPRQRRRTDVQRPEQASAAARGEAPPSAGAEIPYPEILGTPLPTRVTPYRELFPGLLAERVRTMRRCLADVPGLMLAYSVKTCPDPALLASAARLGMAAEAISMDELDEAVRNGFRAHEAILNGPAKWWPRRSSARCRAFFADSVAELEILLRRLDAGFDLRAETVGLRLAVPSVESRFGIRLDRPRTLTAAATLTAELCERLGASWGVHFHQAESALGPARWRATATSALCSAAPIAERLGRGPAMLDFGGGWHPDDIFELADAVSVVRAECVRVLEASDAVVLLEPGKALSEPAAAVVTRAIVVRSRPGDVVVDAALGDIPEAAHRPHPVFQYHRDAWRPIRTGPDRLLGRSCMENDVLRTGLDLRGLAEGDWLAFGLCGAYDLSTAYDFGRGRAGGGL